MADHRLNASIPSGSASNTTRNIAQRPGSPTGRNSEEIFGASSVDSTAQRRQSVIQSVGNDGSRAWNNCNSRYENSSSQQVPRLTTPELPPSINESSIEQPVVFAHREQKFTDDLLAEDIQALRTATLLAQVPSNNFHPSNSAPATSSSSQNASASFVQPQIPRSFASGHFAPHASTSQPGQQLPIKTEPDSDIGHGITHHLARNRTSLNPHSSRQPQTTRALATPDSYRPPTEAPQASPTPLPWGLGGLREDEVDENPLAAFTDVDSGVLERLNFEGLIEDSHSAASLSQENIERCPDFSYSNNQVNLEEITPIVYQALDQAGLPSVAPKYRGQAEANVKKWLQVAGIPYHEASRNDNALSVNRTEGVETGRYAASDPNNSSTSRVQQKGDNRRDIVPAEAANTSYARNREQPPRNTEPSGSGTSRATQNYNPSTEGGNSVNFAGSEHAGSSTQQASRGRNPTWNIQATKDKYPRYSSVESYKKLYDDVIETDPKFKEMSYEKRMSALRNFVRVNNIHIENKKDFGWNIQAAKDKYPRDSSVESYKKLYDDLVEDDLALRAKPYEQGYDIIRRFAVDNHINIENKKATGGIGIPTWNIQAAKDKYPRDSSVKSYKKLYDDVIETDPEFKEMSHEKRMHTLRNFVRINNIHIEDKKASGPRNIKQRVEAIQNQEKETIFNALGSQSYDTDHQRISTLQDVAKKLNEEDLRKDEHLLLLGQRGDEDTNNIVIDKLAHMVSNREISLQEISNLFPNSNYIENQKQNPRLARLLNKIVEAIEDPTGAQSVINSMSKLDFSSYSKDKLILLRRLKSKSNQIEGCKDIIPQIAKLAEKYLQQTKRGADDCMGPADTKWYDYVETLSELKKHELLPSDHPSNQELQTLGEQIRKDMKNSNPVKAADWLYRIGNLIGSNNRSGYFDDILFKSGWFGGKSLRKGDITKELIALMGPEYSELVNTAYKKERGLPSEVQAIQKRKLPASELQATTSKRTRVAPEIEQSQQPHNFTKEDVEGLEYLNNFIGLYMEDKRKDLLDIEGEIRRGFQNNMLGSAALACNNVETVDELIAKKQQAVLEIARDSHPDGYHPIRGNDRIRIYNNIRKNFKRALDVNPGGPANKRRKLEDKIQYINTQIEEEQKKVEARGEIEAQKMERGIRNAQDRAKWQLEARIADKQQQYDLIQRDEAHNAIRDADFRQRDAENRANIEARYAEKNAESASTASSSSMAYFIGEKFITAPQEQRYQEQQASSQRVADYSRQIVRPSPVQQFAPPPQGAPSEPLLDYNPQVIIDEFFEPDSLHSKGANTASQVTNPSSEPISVVIDDNLPGGHPIPGAQQAGNAFIDPTAMDTGDDSDFRFGNAISGNWDTQSVADAPYIPDHQLDLQSLPGERAYYGYVPPPHEVEQHMPQMEDRMNNIRTVEHFQILVNKAASTEAGNKERTTQYEKNIDELGNRFK